MSNDCPLGQGIWNIFVKYSRAIGAGEGVGGAQTSEDLGAVLVSVQVELTILHRAKRDTCCVLNCNCLRATTGVRVCNLAIGIQEIEPDLIIRVVAGKVRGCVRGAAFEVVNDLHCGLCPSGFRRHQGKDGE